MSHEFTLIIEGLDLDDEAQGDTLFERCDDATFGEVDGVGYGDFHREADSLADAVVAAVHDVESVPGLRVVHAEPDTLVTAAEIAERLEFSKEYVRLLANGERHSERGKFPAPVSHVRGRNRLWRWADVAAWSGQADEARDAYALAAVNALLDLRVVRNVIPDDWKRLVYGFVPEAA
jgi:hypothetical protein